MLCTGHSVEVLLSGGAITCRVAKQTSRFILNSLDPGSYFFGGNCIRRGGEQHDFTQPSESFVKCIH